MLGLGEFSTTNDTNEGGDVLGDLNLARREKFSVFSFQWSVVSGQWSVVSGQQAVGSFRLCRHGLKGRFLRAWGGNQDRVVWAW